MADEVRTVIIDNGSSMCKAGFAGEEAPSAVFPCIVGRPNHLQAVPAGQNNVYVGKAAFDKSLSHKYPIEHGTVTNWDDMEKIWRHAFYDELRVDPADHPVLLTEPPMNPKANREKTIQIMFETFNVPSFYLGMTALLSLYTSGLTDGVAFESGDGASYVVPISEGYSLPHAITKFEVAGSDLTDFCMKILNESGCNLRFSSSFTENEMFRDIKEKHCYVAGDYDSELNKAKSTSECDVSYTLPDGNIITISEERLRVPELLFKPQINGFEFDGIDKTIVDSIKKCDSEVRKDLYSNIVLSGGNTMFKGLPERIDKEITALVDPTAEVKVVAEPERKYAAWIGGSIIASMPYFPQMIVTRGEYSDAGPAIVHRKCVA